MLHVVEVLACRCFHNLERHRPADLEQKDLIGYEFAGHTVLLAVHLIQVIVQDGNHPIRGHLVLGGTHHDAVAQHAALFVDAQTVLDATDLEVLHVGRAHAPEEVEHALATNLVRVGGVQTRVQVTRRLPRGGLVTPVRELVGRDVHRQRKRVARCRRIGNRMPGVECKHVVVLGHVSSSSGCLT